MDIADAKKALDEIQRNAIQKAQDASFRNASLCDRCRYELNDSKKTDTSFSEGAPTLSRDRRSIDYTEAPKPARVAEGVSPRHTPLTVETTDVVSNAHREVLTDHSAVH